MRKSKADTIETRKRIVDVASKVFLARGLAATGIADIMVAAGLTQGGFYRHFESKEQLVAEANQIAFDKIFIMLGKKIEGKTARQALDIMADSYLAQMQGEDPEFLCPIANIGSELRHTDEQIRGAACNGYRRMVELIATHARDAGAADGAQLGESVVATLVGAITLARLAPTPADGDAILANAKKTVHVLIDAAIGPAARLS